MNKLVLTALMLGISFVPTCLYWFKLSFAPSESVTYVPMAAHQCSLHQQNEQASLPFGKDFGKFIKQSPIAAANYQIKTIVLDAGHGGKDPGCSGRKSQEKDIALGVVLKLGQKLQRNYPELHVIYTRERDVFIPLYRRAAIANDNKADLFISIHCNYIRGSSVTRGSETYIMGLHTAEENLAVAKRENEAILYEKNYQQQYGVDPNSTEWHIANSLMQNVHLEQSVSFASKVEDQIAAYEKRRSRGVKQAGFLVLRETAMPSVLVEAGFLSNAKEEGYLLTHEGQQNVAESVFRAFQEYKHEVEDYSVFTNSPARDNYRPTQEERELEAAYRNKQMTTTNTTRPALVPLVVHSNPASTAAQEKPEEEVRISRAAIDWEQSNTPDINTSEEDKNYTFRPKISSENKDLESKSSIEYRIQLTASPTLLDQHSRRWLALNKTNYWADPVWEEGQHKYQIMGIKSFNEAEQIRLQMREIGFFDAFVVAYQGLRQLSVNEAVKIHGS